MTNPQVVTVVGQEFADDQEHVLASITVTGIGVGQHVVLSSVVTVDAFGADTTSVFLRVRRDDISGPVARPAGTGELNGLMTVDTPIGVLGPLVDGPGLPGEQDYVLTLRFASASAPTSSIGASLLALVCDPGLST